jgi:hypothetical protein
MKLYYNAVTIFHKRTNVKKEAIAMKLFIYNLVRVRYS